MTGKTHMLIIFTTYITDFLAVLVTLICLPDDFTVTLKRIGLLNGDSSWKA